MPSVGSQAPMFRLPSSGGGEVSLDDFRGKQAVVLYFYPRDDTPGCTREACAFRDLKGEFERKGAAILGVSTDNVASHDRFSGKFGLNFPLLADIDASVSRAYGVYGPKQMMGKRFQGIHRTTFVIDKDGRVKAVFPDVKVDGHADEVMAALG
ncbi:MAG: thioredoxin-dependent thiol peroxidase [Chloroflexi bacterium]|nr:thioredoxin-dependent thiol peroxidase [Chloroflexota bacterium]